MISQPQNGQLQTKKNCPVVDEICSFGANVGLKLRLGYYKIVYIAFRYNDHWQSNTLSIRFGGNKL